MKALTKILALLTVFALLTASCGDDGSDDRSEATDSGSDSTSDATPENEPEPEQDEADSGPDNEETSTPDPADADSGDSTDVEVDGPQRIVSIDPSGTEILFAVGAGDRVVAVDSFSYYPEGTPVTDLSAFSPNVESILGYEPDLVVMGFNADVQAGLEAAGVEVVLSLAPTNFDELFAQVETIGAATGNESDAAQVAQEMREAVDELIANAPDATGLSFYHELDNTLYTVTSSTFIGAVYGLFGLENAADPADADGSSFGYPQLNDEYLVDADPDLIFLADTICCGVDAASIAERPGWDQLTAVQSGNVIELNDDVVSRWGPRIVAFVEAIAAAVAGIA
ncbi:MAG: ABC transporter substrate-binding protein [Acidimicrobiales bacterium]